MPLPATVESEARHEIRAPAKSLAKSAGAFRTISEAADELDVPQHVLRFWESRFAQIKPLKRAGGRRFYRPDDVDLLRGVRRLLHDQGYTIKGAQRVLRERGVRFVQAVGRGQIKAASLPPARHEAEGGVDEGKAATVPEPDLPREDRAALESALRDLRECRALLAEALEPAAP